jgi:type I restriction enzyme S subunit
MDTKALRQKILDLAIHGKLVPQDPSDEPASVLLERIREQKKQMVKEGKLKAKDIKNDTIIFVGEDNLHYEKFQDGSMKCIEDEIPFDVPEGWEWCRLLPLTIKIGAGSTPTGGAAVYSTSGIKFIRSQNVYDDGLILTDVAYISEEINQKKSGSIVKPKDILLNITGGSIGRCALVPDDFDIANVNQHVIIIRLVNPELRKYLHDVITSPYIQEQILSRQVGSGRGGLSAETLSTFLIPLPPMNEQVSIIKKLQDCISYTLTIADAQRSVSDLVSATKSKILDLAIRGKLVPPDPNDEPASVLLERICAEKEELIKQGKIKRDKKESIIFRGDDNSYYEKVGNNVNCIDEKIPFELPEGWAFIRLNTAWELISGRDLSPSEYNDKNDGIPYITGASNFKNGHISLVRWTPVPQVITRRGDLLLTCKGTIGEIAHNNFGEAHIARQIMAIRNIYSLNVDFLALCIEYSMTKIKQAAKGLIPGISREDILNLVIPIPPTKEQENICNKLKVTFSAIEHIEKSLN